MSISNQSFTELIGRKTLIVGDVGVGKTRLTKKLLVEAIEEGFCEDITIIDMAPPPKTLKGVTVGGTLLDSETEVVRHHQDRDIKTPRLSAKDSEEVIRLAHHNVNKINPMLEEFTRDPTRILFVNDISIYLQRGDLEHLWNVLGKAETVVANGYKGQLLREDFGTGLSEREEKLMENLSARMDLVVNL